MPFTASDLADLVTILRDAARTEILPRFNRLEAEDVKTKSHATDFVTIADEAAERFIEAAVAARFGEVLFIGEEVCEARPELLENLGTAERAIIIDPIDGTFNFANRVPAFACIAAVVERGEVVAGVILDPVKEDAAIALRGQGAFVERADGRRRALKVAPAPQDLARFQGAVSWYYAAEPLRSRLLQGLAGVWGAVSYRCGGQEMRLLCEGALDFALYNKLSPWDHAAGWLIHREAGGHAAHFDGSPYRPVDRTGGLLMAPDEASWHRLREALLA